MKNKIFFDSLIYSSSRYVLLLFSLIRNFIIAKVLGPSDYSLWVIITLILTYGDQLHLGFRHAGDRDIPYLEGNKDYDLAKRYTATIFSSILIMSLLGSASLFSLCFIIWGKSQILAEGVAITGIILVSDQISRFYLMLLRTRREFKFSSKVEVIFEVLRTLLVCALIIKFGLHGAILAFAFASIATAVYFVMYFSKSISLSFEKDIVRIILKSSFPLFLANLLYIFLLFFDRLVGSFSLSKGDLGSYGLAALIGQLPLNFTQSVSMVLYPNLSEHFGKYGTIRNSWNRYKDILMMTAILSPLLIGIFFFTTHYFIGWFLPQYINSLHILQILMIGIIFLVMIPFPMMMLLVVGKTKSVTAVQAFWVAVAVLLLLLYRNNFLMTQKIAWITSITFLLTSCTMLFQLIKTMINEAKDAIREFLKIILPPILGAICWLVSSIVVELLYSHKIHQVVSLPLEYVLFIFLYLSVLVGYRKDLFTIKEILFLLRGKVN